LNFPVSSINIGFVEGVGVIAENNEIMGKMESMGIQGVSEPDVLDALTASIYPREDRDRFYPDSSFGDHRTFVLGLASTMPLSNPNSRAPWRKDIRMAIYHNKTSEDIVVERHSNVLKPFSESQRMMPCPFLSYLHSQSLHLRLGKDCSLHY
jgi:hypothetical protein